MTMTMTMILFPIFTHIYRSYIYKSVIYNGGIQAKKVVSYTTFVKKRVTN